MPPVTQAPARSMTAVRQRAAVIGAGVVVLLAVWLFGLPSGPDRKPATTTTPTTRTQFTAALDKVPLPPPDGRPVRLRARGDLAVHLDVRNRSGEPLEVPSVRLSGRVLGMTFFSYRARIDLRLSPGAAEQRDFAFDLSDLEGQATGLLPARLELLGPNGKPLSEKRFAVRIDGSRSSAYGIFGLVVLVTTLALIVGVLAQIAFHRLERNDVVRGTRFAVPGLGLGLTLTTSLSALGAMVPSDGKSVTLVLVLGICGFLLGVLLRPQGAGDRGTVTYSDLDGPPSGSDLDGVASLPEEQVAPEQEPSPPDDEPAGRPPPVPDDLLEPTPAEPVGPPVATTSSLPPEPPAAAAVSPQPGPAAPAGPAPAPRAATTSRAPKPTRPSWWSIRSPEPVPAAPVTRDPRVYEVVPFADWADFLPDSNGVPPRRRPDADEPPGQVHGSSSW